MAHGGLIVSYSPEYLKFNSDPLVLQEIVDKTGGQMLDPSTKPEQIYNRRIPKSSSRQVFDWFLVGLACLVPLDVAIRRVQVDPRMIVGWFRPAQAASTETMGALLQRKQVVDSRLDAQRGVPAASPTQPATSLPEHLADITPTPGKSSHRDSEFDRSGSPPHTPPPEDLLSTTERLLEIKRRRGDTDDSPSNQ